MNYKKAMDFISRYLGKDDPTTEGLIRELHKILVKGVRGGKADPGNYRKVQNYVVNSQTKVGSIRWGQVYTFDREVWFLEGLILLQ